MRWGVITFPGSCDNHDVVDSLKSDLGQKVKVLWHKDELAGNFDCIVLPGGFSYGDYLRCGAMARFSPILRGVVKFAQSGGLVLGICNGFQILCESGLLPGALVRNADLQFICRMTHLRVEETDAPFTSGLKRGQLLKMPVKHGEGCYYADAATLDRLRKNRQILLRYVDSKGLIYLSTPFSRAAAERLERMQVPWYKIGSGECNNYPLIDHVASYGKPIILSTGMNDLRSIAPAVAILRRRRVAFALLHSTSMYPTPYEKVRLGGMLALGREFGDAVLGLSDHSPGNYACFAAVALGGSIVEKHFTSHKSWPGPDVPISIDPRELADLVRGTRAIHAALGGTKDILPEEQPAIDFAYACVVATRDIAEGETFGPDNLWVKRPGTGEIKAAHYDVLLGRRARRAVRMNDQLRWQDIAADSPGQSTSDASQRAHA